jgi:hypothetical protein
MKLELTKRIENDFAYHNASEVQINMMMTTREKFRDMALYVADIMTGTRSVNEVVDTLQTLMFKVNANIVKDAPVQDNTEKAVLKNMPPESVPVIGNLTPAGQDVAANAPAMTEEQAEDATVLDLTKTKFDKKERAAIKAELTARGIPFDESQRSTALAKKLNTARVQSPQTESYVSQPESIANPAATEVAPVIQMPTAPAPVQPAAPVQPVQQQAPVVQQPVAAPAPQPVQPAAPVAAQPLTLEQTQAVIKEFYSKMGEPKTIELLGYFGAQNTSSLQPTSYAPIVKMAQDMMAQAVNAGAGILS